MPNTWSPEQELELLLTVIAQNPPTKTDWQTVQGKLSFTKTVEGIRQHYQAIVKKVNAASADPYAPPTAKKTRKRKAVKESDDEQADKSDEAPIKTPTTPKRRKVAAVSKKVAAVKIKGTDNDAESANAKVKEELQNEEA